ncbi:transporter substrate-binding domain-containing protein [Aestuariibacter halophilus]|uniref:Transporter substrate-binding domain-containing protein n=1 Tax=Fluctibacter halophilus TaxID=226011 RepID=A0ABS8G430_9ALTE|nr:transporter substrate-binding domain-containing protein [Aestuariibacter halophilus]MCC2615283.1 transporter substrate-binding domain-containing protein [Aestuariibacter halophilus]
MTYKPTAYRRSLCAVMLLACLWYTPGHAQPTLAQQAAQFTWIMEEYPPYHYTQDGVPQGYAVDVLHALFESHGEQFPAKRLVVYPWARAYHTLRNDPKAVVMSMALTPERASQFRFVGPLVSSRISLVAKANVRLPQSHTTQINRFRVGVVRDDIGEIQLLQQSLPFHNIVRVNDAEQLIALLLRDRVDAIAYAEDVVLFSIRQHSPMSGPLHVLQPLGSNDLHFAFHLQAPDGFVTQLQARLDLLSRNQTLLRLKNKHHLEDAAQLNAFK